jgi:hypothetical protein
VYTECVTVYPFCCTAASMTSRSPFSSAERRTQAHVHPAAPRPARPCGPPAALQRRSEAHIHDAAPQPAQPRGPPSALQRLSTAHLHAFAPQPARSRSLPADLQKRTACSASPYCCTAASTTSWSARSSAEAYLSTQVHSAAPQPAPHAPRGPPAALQRRVLS